MGDKPEGTIPLESPLSGPCVAAGICLQDKAFAQLQGGCCPQGGRFPLRRGPLFLAAVGWGGLGVNGENGAVGFCREEGRQHQTRRGERTKGEGAADSRGKSCRSGPQRGVFGAVAAWWGCCWLWGRMASPGLLPAPCWVPSEVGLAGAG